MTNPGNPLLASSTTALPDWAAIGAGHVGPAIETLLADVDAGLEAALATDAPAEYDHLARTLEMPLERLSRTWSAVAHLAAVADTPELRAAFNAALGPVTALHTRLGADERLFARYKDLAADARVLAQPQRKRVVELALRDFRLAGAELQGEAKQRHAQIQARLAELSQAFAEHELDAIDRYALDVDDESRLVGLPPEVKSACRNAAERAGVAGWRLSIRAPVYVPVQQHLQDRELRRQLYLAFVGRASALGPAEFDNTPLIDEIVALRHEQALLLGLPSYAAQSLKAKMAATPEAVFDFLHDLARRVRPRAQAEIDELRSFARSELGIDDLQPWDISYASERLREARYAYSTEELKAYFPLPVVLQGLFAVFETLFDIVLENQPCVAWHPSVRLIRIARRSQPSLTVAHVWLDLHARNGKRSGAWQGNARGRWQRPDGTLQSPLAQIVCNFAAPQDDRPTLLTHGELLTLLHEFGHGLHHVLTQVDEVAVAGTAGVEWDAVELPSLFLENFGWEWDVLRRITRHVDSGVPLPRALFDRLHAARNFQTGLQTLRQLGFGLFDLQLHHEPPRPGRALALAQEVHAAIQVVPRVAEDRYPCSFGHLFAGGYAAGYYSYKWAEVLSCDAWSAFEQAGVLDVDTGTRYRREILETGGSRAAMDNFRAFRGREPRIDALLQRLGVA